LILAFIFIYIFGITGCNPFNEDRGDTVENNPVTFSVRAELESEPMPGVPGQNAADDENGIPFVGEEGTGIWTAKLNKWDNLLPSLIPEGIVGKNPSLKDDIEGLAISYSSSGGYLIASSQGNNSYAIFNKNPPHHFVGSFTVSTGDFDATEETDGIEICTLPLHKKFPYGIFYSSGWC
jgi:3-phytase